MGNDLRSYSLLLIGAGNRAEFLGLLRDAASSLGVELRIFSVENSDRVPISTLAKIVVVPEPFDSTEFRERLLDVYRKESFDLVLPLMDAAVKPVLELGLPSPVNSASLYSLNKRNLKDNASSRGVKVPPDVSSGIAHVRPIFGNGGKGIKVIEDASVIDPAFREEFLVEELLPGPELSFDVYVFQDSHFNVSVRERLRVVGGEVQHTKTRPPSDGELEQVSKILTFLHLRGPINIQYRGNPLHLLEINPRFGGGATASLHAGWLATRWLIEEYLLQVPASRTQEAVGRVEVIRAWRDFVWR